MQTNENGTFTSSYSLAPDKNDASFLLHVLRIVAAEAVVFGHAISFFRQYPSLEPPHAPYMQNISVVFFFLLSGFLISHSLRKKLTEPDYGFGSFVIDRTSRIYAGFIPALFFVAVLDLAVIKIGIEYPYTQAFNIPHFVGNILMLQDHPAWGIDSVRYLLGFNLTSFGSARPFWTIAIEMWIYLFIGSVIFLLIRKSNFWTIPLVFFFALVPCVNFLWGRGHGLFFAWLLGAIAEWMIHNNHLNRLSSPSLAFFMFFSIGLYITYHWSFNTDTYFPLTYPILAAAFLFAVSLCLRTGFTINKQKIYTGLSFASGFTYTLFLVHYSIMSAVVTVAPQEYKLTAMWLAIAASQLVAIMLAQYGERKASTVKRALLFLSAVSAKRFIVKKTVS